MRVAVRKLAGVESVDVSLERAGADIKLREGNSITLEELRLIVRNNGFTAKEATVTAVGRLIARDEGPALEVTGTKTFMLIVADPKGPGAFNEVEERIRAKTTTPVRVHGVVEFRADSPHRIAVDAVSDEKR